MTAKKTANDRRVKDTEVKDTEEKRERDENEKADVCIRCGEL